MIVPPSSPCLSVLLGVAIGAFCISCASPRSSSEPTGARGRATAPSRESRDETRRPQTAIAHDTPTKARLTIPEARRYMLALINRDRRSQGLRPVELDEGPAQAAGQEHAEDMANLGYLGHWGSDGSVPEERHTRAGGANMVLENALCFTDESVRTLDRAPLIERAQVERAESMFFDEVPPHDGHRKNILRPSHTHVGIGIAQPIATATEIPIPCFTQEFTDAYGTYTSLPKRSKVGTIVHVEGTLAKGAAPKGVGIAQVDIPTPIAARELNTRRSYPVPKPYVMYWLPGFVTPKPLKVDGRHFEIDVPLSGPKKTGLYEISVWASLDGAKENTLVSLRTIIVE